MKSTFIAQNNNKPKIVSPIVFNANTPYSWQTERPGFNNLEACIESYIVPSTNWYIIYGSGASGCSGSIRSGQTEYMGGRGAEVTTRIFLKKGEQLRIVVGRNGRSINTNAGASSSDGVAGAGGGSSSVWKVIDNITDSRFQFIKNGNSYTGEKWECLLFVAGGCGTRDGIYGTGYTSGTNASILVYTPTDFKACTSDSYSVSTSTNASKPGPFQILNYDGIGPYYSRNGDTCWGGFGGGGSSDDSVPTGNAWSIDGPDPNFILGNFCYGELLDIRIQSDYNNGSVLLYEVTE